MRTVYLAGPEVFLPAAAEVGARKKALCRERGLEGLFPGDAEVPAGPGADGAIFAACVAAMRMADVGVFNLTPFRGVGADVGTVWELGFMVGLGKPVWGYSNVAGPVLGRLPGAVRGVDGVWRDGAGWMAEDFGNGDNLMIDRSLPPGGFVRLDRGGRLDDLDGFVACLELVRGGVRDGG